MVAVHPEASLCSEFTVPVALAYYSLTPGSPPHATMTENNKGKSLVDFLMWCHGTDVTDTSTM